MNSGSKRAIAIVAALMVLAAAVIFWKFPRHPRFVKVPVIDAGDVVTRLYDPRDLLIEVPNFVPFNLLSVDRSTSQPSSNPSAPPARTRQEVIRDAMRLISNSVDPKSWQQNGGTIGSIRELSGQFIITQSPTNHALIQKKLEEIRIERGVQIVVEVRIIGAESVQKVLRQTGLFWKSIPGNEAALWPEFLDASRTAAIVKAVRADPSGAIITAPRMTLFDKQRAYVLVSRQAAYVKAFEKKISATQPAGWFDPVIGIADTGILLDCQATADASRKNVTLALRPKRTSLVDLTPAPWSGAPPDRTDLIVQVPHISELSLDTSVTVPDKSTAVFRVRAKRTPAATQPSDEPTVLILATPRIVLTAPAPATQPAPLLSTSQPAKESHP